MIAWRSPSDAGPPSIFTPAGTGYGPGSDSSAYSKETPLFGTPLPTTVIGIPIGPPSHVPEPKSGWRVFTGPIEAIRVSEPAATGSASTRRFHALSAGKTGQPASVGPGGAAAGAVPARAAATTTAAATAPASRPSARRPDLGLLRPGRPP